MPVVATLFSAGKDSALAARLLDPFYDVVLCTCSFGVDSDPSVTDTARDAAAALELPVTTVALDPGVARSATERIVDDGYPNAGIQQVHEHALETVAALDSLALEDSATASAADGRRPVDAVADGTRRDDRAPTVERPFARSLEDRHGVDYVRPLAGYGRRAVDDLVDRHLTVETGPSERLATADYETELRALVAAEYGSGTVADVFPTHTQSRVTGRLP